MVMSWVYVPGRFISGLPAALYNEPGIVVITNAHLDRKDAKVAKNAAKRLIFVSSHLEVRFVLVP